MFQSLASHMRCSALCLRQVCRKSFWRIRHEQRGARAGVSRDGRTTRFWIFSKVLNLDIHIARYHPLGGGSRAKTLPRMGSKKATINVENQDEECFKYAVLAALERRLPNSAGERMYSDKDAGIQQPHRTSALRCRRRRCFSNRLRSEREISASLLALLSAAR